VNFSKKNKKHAKNSGPQISYKKYVYRNASIKSPPSFKRPNRINAPLFQFFFINAPPLLNAPSNKRHQSEGAVIRGTLKTCKT